MEGIVSSSMNFNDVGEAAGILTAVGRTRGVQSSPGWARNAAADITRASGPFPPNMAPPLHLKKERADGLARSHAEVPGLSGFQLPTGYLQKLSNACRNLDLSTRTPRCSLYRGRGSPSSGYKAEGISQYPGSIVN